MSASKMQGRNAGQSGLALITALIMLVVLTLLVVAGINMTNVNTKIAYNMQLQDEAQAAMQQAISKASILDIPLPPLQTIGVDFDNDGTTDYRVSVPTPVCIASTPIKQNQLDSSNPQDIPCLGTSVLQNSGIVGGTGSSGNSLCANTTWDVSASYSNSAGTGLSVTTHQGVNLKVVAGTSC